MFAAVTTFVCFASNIAFFKPRNVSTVQLSSEWTFGMVLNDCIYTIALLE